MSGPKAKEVRMKHLADHRNPSSGAKLKHFLRIDRAASDWVWRLLRQRDRLPQPGNRRVLEYVRIERGRQI
jgi:hypothetical protein